MTKDPRLPFSEIGRKELEQLYEWDVDEAIQAQELWSIENPGEARGPFWQWQAVQSLEIYRELFKNGNQTCILPAVFQCAMNGLPLPTWCAQAFINSFRKASHYRAKSWDEVFGRPHPKGAQIGARRKKRADELKVYSRIREIKKLDPTTPTDSGLFERVGEELGICKTLVGEYYYSMKKYFSMPPNPIGEK